MDSKEFGTFAARLKRLFKGFADYVDGLETGDRAAIAKEWERGLANTEFVDAMEALTDIHIGEAKSFNTWEFGTWLAHVRTLAAAKRSQRMQAVADTKPKRWEEAPRAGSNLGGIYRQIMAIVDAKGDTSEALARLLPVDDRDGPRYKCWKCQDSGFVTVWHIVTMREVERGETLTPRNSNTMSTLCNCERGRSKVSPPGSHRIVWTDGHVFDEAKHCLCPHGDVKNAENVASLKEFIGELPQRQLESKQNYSATLARWSKGSERDDVGEF